MMIFLMELKMIHIDKSTLKVMKGEERMCVRVYVFFFHSWYCCVDILSPIEIPTDIVRRPALKRIIKSPQIEGLASTAMEFIESEKNFSKILSRLSAILHRDDPQYLDLVLERTPEQRKRRKTSQQQQQQQSATAAASSSSEQDKAKDNESEQPLLQAKEEEMETTAEDFGPDTEAIEVVRSVRELLLVSRYI